MIEEVKVLAPNYVELIMKFLEKCKAEKIRKLYPNELLRDDVMSILEKNSMVIYYPLEETEKNNGFLVRGLSLYGVSEECNFVFINTAKPTEKQAFAAAHELGHIWGLSDYFAKNDIELDLETEELVMNRFAAELMVPEGRFMENLRNVVCEIRNSKNDESTTLELDEFAHIIVMLMNVFFVPDVAIVRRLNELECITSETVNYFVNELKKPEESTFRELIRKSVNDMGYFKLLRPTQKKWINDLPELLEKAEKKGALTEEKIRMLRDSFEIKEGPANWETRSIDVTISKGRSEQQ